jgi:RNA polymerase sigma-70 factor, ECF subfamily
MSVPIVQAASTADFGQLFGALRPKLHRYCARMTGSILDGEDVVQEALIKAFEALPRTGPLAYPEAWLFRIAHNAALDFLRRRNRQESGRVDDDPDALIDPAVEADGRLSAAASLHLFARLPAMQRSCVILMDVLGYTLQDIGTMLETSTGAVKAALHRGRTRLRHLANEPEDRQVPALAKDERQRLAAYVERFNARDFDALRELLADDVRLDLVGRTRVTGRQDVARYFHNYSTRHDWHFALGLVEGRLAAVVSDVNDPAAPPAYFVLLDWRDGRLAAIRDFRYARYAATEAEISLVS